MKQALKSFTIGACALLIMALNACNVKDSKMIVDQSKEIDNQTWSYNNRVKTDFTINDVSSAYNLYFNLRVTPDYKYSNMFVLIHQTGPDKQTITTRYEFKLADKDGEWLGDGTGNLYSFQIVFQTKHRFAQKGKYHIEMEQNMRDNPLKQVSDVGLRVERAE